MTVPTPATMPSRAADPAVVTDRASADPASAVAEAMAGLGGLAVRPLTEHVDAFERVHVALGEALAAGSV